MKAAFPEVERIKFEGPQSKNPLSFRHYNADEKVGGVFLSFAIENRGNVDIDLIMFETMIPSDLLHATYARPEWPNIIDWESVSEDGRAYSLARYYSLVAPREAGSVRGLRPVLTRSMGRVELRSLRVGLKAGAVTSLQRYIQLYYQLFARDYETTRESIAIRDIAWI